MKIDLTRIKGDPVPYMQSVIYDYHQRLIRQATPTPAPPLTQWEEDWLMRVKKHQHQQEEASIESDKPLSDWEKLLLDEQKERRRKRLAAETAERGKQE